MKKVKQVCLFIYRVISEVIIFLGTFSLVLTTMLGMQYILDGAVQPSNSDAVVALILSLLLAARIYDSYILKDVESVELTDSFKAMLAGSEEEDVRFVETEV